MACGSMAPSAHRAAVRATARPSLRACESGIRTQPRPGVEPGAPSTRLRTGPSVRGVRRECGCRESHVQRSLARIIVPPTPIRKRTAARRKPDKQHHESTACHAVRVRALCKCWTARPCPLRAIPDSPPALKYVASQAIASLPPTGATYCRHHAPPHVSPIASPMLQFSRRRPTIPGGVSLKRTDRALEAMQNTRRMSGRSASE